MAFQDEWPLKTKDGVIITMEQMPIELRNKIAKLNRQDLFPPKFGINEIEKPEYNPDGTLKEKRWMNSFMVFRRVLGLFYKDSNTVFNGTELSQLAQLIWHGASVDEKKIYTGISANLKKRTYNLNPNFVFRKAQKPVDEYINYGPETFEKKGKRKHEDDDYGQRNKKRTSKKDTESTNVASNVSDNEFISNTSNVNVVSNTSNVVSNTSNVISNTSNVISNISNVDFITNSNPITPNMDSITSSMDSITSNTDSVTSMTPNTDSTLSNLISNIDSIISNLDPNEQWFPYNGQEFNDGGQYLQNNISNTDSTADAALWSQSFEATVDPFSENALYPGAIMWGQNGMNFFTTYETQGSCEFPGLEGDFDNECCEITELKTFNTGYY
ncbi:590_t:CDS:1 [Racocetra persica]|uniref:590_t:CDS:1 n=1 Tax=Racocetra persica TaxID=160502 RepID=A0ACA9KUP4_9GLOM|nr:590_t:CDS:1 [Racocetra persica]